MSSVQIAAREQKPPAVQVWDSHYAPGGQAFASFREAVCTAFMPWTPERGDPETDFEGRIETVRFEGGSLGLCTTRGLFARKTKDNISRSPLECVYGNYVISGELTLEQADRQNVARPGDLVIYQSFRPISFIESQGRSNMNLAFSIPLSRFRPVGGAESLFLNRLIPSARLIAPLAGCLDMLAREVRTSPAEEMSALFDACVALLPLALGRDDPAPTGAATRGGLPRELLALIDDRLSDPGLSPGRIASRLGVSTRQVHKLFARSGLTFGGYVMGERLERVRAELGSSTVRRRPISDLAFRWGFSDLSTFNRAFKRRFGVPPRMVRS